MSNYVRIIDPENPENWIKYYEEMLQEKDEEKDEE